MLENHTRSVYKGKMRSTLIHVHIQHVSNTFEWRTFSDFQVLSSARPAQSASVYVPPIYLYQNTFGSIYSLKRPKSTKRLDTAKQDTSIRTLGCRKAVLIVHFVTAASHTLECFKWLKYTSLFAYTATQDNLNPNRCSGEYLEAQVARNNENNDNYHLKQPSQQKFCSLYTGCGNNKIATLLLLRLIFNKTLGYICKETGDLVK